MKTKIFIFSLMLCVLFNCGTQKKGERQVIDCQEVECELVDTKRDVFISTLWQLILKNNKPMLFSSVNFGPDIDSVKVKGLPIVVIEHSFYSDGLELRTVKQIIFKNQKQYLKFLRKEK